MEKSSKIAVNERVSFEEIQKNFPDSWVVLKNPTYIGNSPDLLEAVFLYKNKNQDKAFEKIPVIKKRGFIGNEDRLTVRYTGGPLDNLEYIFVI